METTTQPIIGSTNTVGPVIINEEIYNRLLQMFKSSDSENHLMGQKILTQCDVQKSIYWIWEMSRKGRANRMVYLRTKAGRKFQEESNLFVNRHVKYETFAAFLLEKNWMTEEIFQRLRPGIKNDLAKQFSNKFFAVDITVKDEYREYDPNSVTENLIPINNEYT